jgi:hypothetical protein
MVVFFHSKSFVLCVVLCVLTEFCGVLCDVFTKTRKGLIFLLKNCSTWWNSILILLICYRVQRPRAMSIIKNSKTFCHQKTEQIRVCRGGRKVISKSEFYKIHFYVSVYFHVVFITNTVIHLNFVLNKVEMELKPLATLGSLVRQPRRDCDNRYKLIINNYPHFQLE